MKLLVLEQNELVSKIYKKIFEEKKYDADYARNDLECLERFDKNYDYVVLENSNSGTLEQKIRKIKPDQKILSLSQYINSEGPSELKETRELIEKPFAVLTMISSLELECTNLHN
jgi:DNA-binding response OmpR family regulator